MMSQTPLNEIPILCSGTAVRMPVFLGQSESRTPVGTLYPERHDIGNDDEEVVRQYSPFSKTVRPSQK